MLQAAPAFLAKTAYSALLTSATQELSPTKIRQSIADLVGKNRLAEADLLSNEALQRFPQSEDILVIRALVTQVRQDWPAASAALEKHICGHFNGQRCEKFLLIRGNATTLLLNEASSAMLFQSNQQPYYVLALLS